MGNGRLSRFRLCVAAAAMLAVVGAGFAAPAARAGLLSCGPGSRPFAAVDGDTHTYYSMLNGGFESGALGWSLSGGASVVPGNEPWSVSGGSHSLALPSGSSVLGPPTCIALLSPTLRMFANDSGGGDGGLRARVEFRGLLGNLLGIGSYATFDRASYQGWRPTSTVPTSLLAGVPLMTAYFQLRIAPVGAGSAWTIDDVLVDPWVCRVG